MNVHISGDRSGFLSKNAITRLRNDVKASSNSIDEKKYLQDGYTITVEVVENNTMVNVIKKPIVTVDKSAEKLELRKKVRTLLNESRKERSGEMKKRLESLKRSVPPKIFSSYTNLMSKYKLSNIPAPDEVINNVEKYKIQISAVMGKMGKVSNDPMVSNAVRHYFTTLGDFLGIEPMSVDMVNQLESQFGNMSTPPTKENDDDTDEED